MNEKEEKKKKQCHAECKSSSSSVLNSNMTAAIILAYTVHKCGIAIIQHILTRAKMRNSTAHTKKMTTTTATAAATAAQTTTTNRKKITLFFVFHRSCCTESLFFSLYFNEERTENSEQKKDSLNAIECDDDGKYVFLRTRNSMEFTHRTNNEKYSGPLDGSEHNFRLQLLYRY